MTLTDAQIGKLGAPLDRGRVKQRDSGRGPALSYLETHDVIRAANDIFGFGQWGHEIDDLRPVAPVTRTKDGKTGIQVGYICIVKLTVNGCQPVSGVGYGDAVEYVESAPVTAHELAAKEAESDALKRALKNYGDQFGLVLYSKDQARSEHLNGSPAQANGGGAQTTTSPGEGAATANGSWVWPSGKHQGKTLAETPRSYVEWAATGHPKPETQQKCAAFLAGGGEAATMAALADDDVPF